MANGPVVIGIAGLPGRRRILAEHDPIEEPVWVRVLAEWT